jgi:hypothetical protein
MLGPRHNGTERVTEPGLGKIAYVGGTLPCPTLSQALFLLVLKLQLITEQGQKMRIDITAVNAFLHQMFPQIRSPLTTFVSPLL